MQCHRSVFAAVAAVLLLCGAAACADDAAKVFAGAVGFGTDSPAGRGGKVIKVTTLDAKGPGSLREAIEATGPRIVVFEVAGIIDLGKGSMSIREPFITIAGQTAPSPGITIIGGSLYIKTHDVLIQHIRVRPGDCGGAKKSGWEPDGISTDAAHHVVIDHCSVSWSVDENLTASGPRYDGPDATTHDATFSNCIVAEGLRDSTHKKGPHSMGSLIHDFCQNISIVGNLYAHNNARNPYFKACTTGVVVNNVIQNPGSNAIQVGYPDSEWTGRDVKPSKCKICVVGNVYFPGPDTRKGLAMVANKGEVYMEDNLATGIDGAEVPLTSGDVTILTEKPVWPEGLKALPASEALASVVAHAGARPRDRDAVDKRIIQQLLDRQGRIIDSQDQVGGYPACEPVRRTLNVPTTGIDEWLAKMAAEVQ
jgi:hypothetical protein